MRKFGGAYGLAAIARVLQSQANTNIVSTPNLITLDNEEAKIVVGRTCRSSPASYTNTGTADDQPVPDHRAQGRRHHAAHQAADRRERHGAHDDLPGVVEPELDRSRPAPRNAGPSTNKRSIESHGGRRRRPDHRARRPDRGHATPTTSRRCRCSATSRTSARCSAARAATQEAHQPDGLPAPGGDARRRRRRTSSRSTATT